MIRNVFDIIFVGFCFKDESVLGFLDFCKFRVLNLFVVVVAVSRSW